MTKEIIVFKAHCYVIKVIYIMACFIVRFTPL